jgi:hypothetical protein
VPLSNLPPQFWTIGNSNTGNPKCKGCYFLGIVFTTLAVYPIGRWWSGTTTGALVNYKGIFTAPDFSLLFQLDLA